MIIGRRKQEEYINSFPHYKADIVDDDGRIYSIHFAALFSEKKSAIPTTRLHGWPASFQEFLPVLDLLRKKYSPQDLPYHIIVPSLPGYTLSSPPPLDRPWKIADSARIMHKLMLNLGFGDGGYVVQGGDIGAAVGRTMAATYPECKALHLNYCFMFPPDDASASELSDTEKKGLERFDAFNATGNAYGREHGTRPATIGHVLSASPVALLAWIGEKYLEWSDAASRLPLSTILAEVSLYWFTGCMPTSIYPYEEDFLQVPHPKGYFHAQAHLFVDKPLGYSYFPRELAPMPRSWVGRTGRLCWFRGHEEGGHFPALERPGEMLADLEDFVGEVWE